MTSGQRRHARHVITFLVTLNDYAELSSWRFSHTSNMPEPSPAHKPQLPYPTYVTSGFQRRDAKSRGETQRRGEPQMDTARQSRNRMEEDRIVGGQNHAKQRRDLCLQKHRRRGCMILSSHDSVSHLGLHEESSQLANNLDIAVQILRAGRSG